MTPRSTSPKPLALPGRRNLLRLLAGGALVFGGAVTSRAAHPGPISRVPPPASDLPADGKHPQTALLAGGCFWGVQGVFQHVDGVQQAVSGYCGDTAASARYETVSTGRTRHAETVEIRYDPSRISYGALLQIFFSVVHDPTQIDRQGPDIGPQYRSMIFTANAAQAQIAGAYIAQLDATRVFGKPIATRIESAAAFFPAEPYHQDFLVEHPDHPYIVFHDLPKLAQLARLFPERYRSEPVLVKKAAQ